MEGQSTLGKRLVKWLATAFAVYLAAEIVSGIEVASFWTAMVVGLVLGLLNLFIKPILALISIPFILISFGLFLVVINAVLLMFASEVVGGFTVTGFWPAVWGSIVISIVSMFFEPRKKNDNGGDGIGVRADSHARG